MDKFFAANIENLTLKNKHYLKVEYTTPYSQFTTMSIPINKNIPIEKHQGDQFIRIEQGNGKLYLGKNGEKYIDLEKEVGFHIPSNTYHEVVNTGNIALKLYSIYSPPQHPEGHIIEN